MFLVPHSMAVAEVGPMWAKLMDTKNAYTAELWKELLNGEALSVRVVPASGWAKASELEPHAIYVPWGKLHVAQEILRKI